MAKYNKAKARAIAEFLAIAVGLGIISGSQWPATGTPAKRSPEDLRVFQQYTADVNEVVTELRKKGLPVVDDFKAHESVKLPAGKRIMVITDLKKNPNSIYRSPESRRYGEKDYSRFASAEAGWPIIDFLEHNPKAVSEKTIQRIKALNNSYNKELVPIFKKYDKKLAASRKREKIAYGTATGLGAASFWHLGRKGRIKRKLRRKQQR